MEKNIKIIIGANYGDEGKGLLTRHFAVETIQNQKKGIVILHNGSAQHGHTVDYNPHFRHVYHHFGCGTGDGLPTYFAETFWIHPMEFVREYVELAKSGIYPKVYYHPQSRVVTPFDMLIDHATEAWIALQHGEREFGSCGYGTWCAIESRNIHMVYTINEFKDYNYFNIMDTTWKECLTILIQRGVDVEKLPEYRDYFIPNSWKRQNLINNFKKDLDFFFAHATSIEFDGIYSFFDNLIFETGQGLGLDINVDNDWHTTSNTGLTNPVEMLKDKEDFNAEVCYVSRAYITRHGIGPMENEALKKEINDNMIDRTNVHNDFQGSLRYGYPEDREQKIRIEKDWNIIKADKRFNKTIAITHCNEFPDFDNTIANYISYNPYSVLEN